MHNGNVDNPGVRVSPPVIFAGALLVGKLLQLAVPMRPRRPLRDVGMVLIGGWAALTAPAICTLLRGGGTLNTQGAAQGLVTTGLYRYSRNPVYLSLALLYSGLALVLNAAVALLFLPPLLAYVERFVIRREEAYLERRFGEEYRAYKRRVRRWL